MDEGKLYKEEVVLIHLVSPTGRRAAPNADDAVGVYAGPLWNDLLANLGV